jgi:hypothetical protein
LASAYVAADCDATSSGHYLNFAWYDPEIPEASPADQGLPPVHHFEDIDIVSARTSWSGNPTQLVVKCGPPLGHKHEKTKQDYGSGHAHPDAGHFLYVADGKILFRDSGYTKPKETGNHSTLLIDGKGQKGEGNTWFNFRPWLTDQRAPRIRSVDEKDGTTTIDCEVAPAYPLELGLDQFDRILTLARNGSLTITDTVATAAPSEYEWRFQVEGELEREDDTTWLLRSGETAVRIRLKATVPVTCAVAKLDTKGHPPYLSVRSTGKASAARLETLVEHLP